MPLPVWSTHGFAGAALINPFATTSQGNCSALDSNLADSGQWVRKVRLLTDPLMSYVTRRLMTAVQRLLSVEAKAGTHGRSHLAVIRRGCAVSDLMSGNEGAADLRVAKATRRGSSAYLRDVLTPPTCETARSRGVRRGGSLGQEGSATELFNACQSAANPGHQRSFFHHMRWV